MRLLAACMPSQVTHDNKAQHSREGTKCARMREALFAQTCQVFDEGEQRTEHRGEKLKLTYESFHASVTPVLTLVLIIRI